MGKLHGAFAAIVSPFDETEKLNTAALRPVIESGLAKGTSGFYVCGSTGESYMMNFEERKQILEDVISMVAGRAKVMVNIGAFSSRHAQMLAKHAAKAGADAISSVAPFYFPFSKKELIKYYRDLAQCSGLPVLVYNIPSMSGIQFTTGDLCELLSDDGIQGIKQTTLDLFQTEQLVTRFPEKSIINGHDEIFLSALSVGVTSCIGSTVTFMPELFIKVQKCFEAGDMVGALEAQKRINNIIAVLCRVGIFKGVKAALQYRGMDCGLCRKPFMPLTETERQDLEAVLKENL